MATETQHPHLPLPEYFSKFAGVYVHQTGHSTLDILSDAITENVQTSGNPIGADSVVHDNAAGPGIGAAALVARLPKDQLPKELLVSDNVAMMVTAAQESLTASPLPHAECKELDSQDLSSSVPDDHFTHSITNFSIFVFVRPGDAVREIYRTLRPGGLALITCWRRFAPYLIVKAAQAKTRPESVPYMPTPNPQFFEEGVLQKVVEEGGFVFTVTEEHKIAGLEMLMSGPLMAKARDGYTETEKAAWAGNVRLAVADEVRKYGGVRFEVYILLVTK